jgi:hypothetical protein
LIRWSAGIGGLVEEDTLVVALGFFVHLSAHQAAGRRVRPI